jgi:filamentous hemagglutinin family protein
VNGNPTTYLISDNLGTRAGNNLFHSFGAFNIGTGESATFTGPAGIQNVIGRVTGGTPSSIDGTIRSTIDGANLFLLNPSGVLFGPNAGLDVKGSFHVSTADYLKFSDGQVFYANPASTSVLSVAAPEAFGFLAPTPAGISGNKAYLSVPEGQTLSVVGGELTFQGYPVSTDPSAANFVFYLPGVLSAPGGKVNLASLSSPGEVRLADLDTGGAKLGNISFTDGAKISVIDFTSAGVPLAAGTVVIRGGQILLKDGGLDAYGDPGGVVDIRGNALHLDDYYLYAASFGATDHPGTAFNIQLSDQLLMTHSSLIDSSNYGPGRGGDIRIAAPTLYLGDETLDDRSYTGSALGFFGYISATNTGSGNGGQIAINTQNATLRNGFMLTTATYADGSAGNITLSAADTLQLRDCGVIGSIAVGAGRGGDVNVAAKNVLISSANQGAVMAVDPNFLVTGISAQTGAASSGGTLKVDAGEIQILDGGKITTLLMGSGHGADIDINTGKLTVSGSVNVPGVDYFLSSVDARLAGPDATGTGGNVSIKADTLNVTEAGSIRTALDGAPSPGQAGNVTINAGEINIASRGGISADSFKNQSSGDSGNLTLTTGTLSITGAAGTPRPAGIDFDFTGLSTTTNAGRGGTIKVTASGDVLLSAGGGINADTQGTGSGGAVNIQASNLVVAGQSTVTAATSAAGPAGDITISAGSVWVQQAGTISTQSSGAGRGGSVELHAATVELSDNGKISSTSTGSGNAGNIGITTDQSLVLRDASITTAADQADGGNITITTGNMLKMIDSKITASVGGGPQTTGGNIRIDPDFVVLKNSRIVANAFEGRGGNISIVADTFLADPSSVVDASSALGINGTVDIQAPISDLSGLLSPLNTDFVSAAALLKERCMARIREGKYSSFIVGGRDGLPVAPGNPLPALAQ